MQVCRQSPACKCACSWAPLACNSACNWAPEWPAGRGLSTGPDEMAPQPPNLACFGGGCKPLTNLGLLATPTKCMHSVPSRLWDPMCKTAGCTRNVCIRSCAAPSVCMHTLFVEPSRWFPAVIALRCHPHLRRSTTSQQEVMSACGVCGGRGNFFFQFFSQGR